MNEFAVEGPGDDPEFVRIVNTAIDRAIAMAGATDVVIIKIDNFFDSDWLGFAGKTLGALGLLCDLSDPIIPPFVPSRVLTECIFKAGAQGYTPEALAPGYSNLHLLQPSSDACRRKLSQVAPYHSVFWWSSKSIENSRGSLMGYLNEDETYWCWYLAFEEDGDWSLKTQFGVSQRQLKKMLPAANPN